MIAEFFIERPILANVIAVLMLVSGGVSPAAAAGGPIPTMTPPTIQVTTSYPGASALTVQQQVGRAIEQQVNGVEGMIYMQSNSSDDGRYTLTVSFAVGTDTDQRASRRAKSRRHRRPDTACVRAAARGRDEEKIYRDSANRHA